MIIIKAAIVDKEKLTDIINLKTKNIDELKFFVSYPHHTTFAYFTEGGKEYLVPFGSRPDITGLENAKIYTPSEVISVLKDSFDTAENNNNGETLYAGLADTSVSKQNKYLYVAAAAVILFAAASIGILFIKSKHSLKKAD